MTEWLPEDKSKIPMGSIQIELAGVAEIATELGVARTTVSMWDSRHEVSHFPEPLARLAAGPVYDMGAVRHWYATRVDGRRKAQES